jgi:hypothetical protein
VEDGAENVMEEHPLRNLKRGLEEVGMYPQMRRPAAAGSWWDGLGAFGARGRFDEALQLHYETRCQLRRPLAHDATLQGRADYCTLAPDTPCPRSFTC